MLDNLITEWHTRSVNRWCWIALSVALVLLWTTESRADDNGFWIKPDQCISNFKGQDCNKRIVLSWSFDANAEHCLFRSSKKAPVVCWENMSLKRYTLQFKSSRNETFFIRRTDNDELVAEIEFTVAWVYRSGRKSFFGWRVF